jgi:hypothetical protein
MLLLDSAFGIFDNIQPRIDLCELDLQLPCDPIYFKTASYHEMAINSLFPHQKMKVLDAYQKLFTGPSGASRSSDLAEKSSLNSWDLLIMIHRTYFCLSPITCPCARSLLLSDPYFANSSLLICLAPNLFKPAFADVVNIGVAVCHGLGTLKACNPKLESLLGRSKGIHPAGRLARHGLRDFSR